MKTKVGKRKNLVKGELVKKANHNLVVYSKDEPTVKADNKLTAKEKEKQGKNRQLKLKNKN